MFKWLIFNSTPDDVPAVPWKGLTAAFQSFDPFPYGGERRCVGCNKNAEEIRADAPLGGVRVEWAVLDANNPWDSFLASNA